MRKIITLAAAFMATVLSYQAVADSWIATTSAEFTSALGQIGRKFGARDTIFVNPESPDVIISTGTGTYTKMYLLPASCGLSVCLPILSQSFNCVGRPRLIPSPTATSVSISRT